MKSDVVFTESEEKQIIKRFREKINKISYKAKDVKYSIIKEILKEMRNEED